MPILNKDMQVCISLAGRPSNLGTRFHNFLYDELGLNFIYKAFTTDDIEGAVRGIRALGIRGCSVSMPFKEAVIPLVDIVEQSASAIESVNTIVNDDGVLTGSNTDYEAIAELAVLGWFASARRGSPWYLRLVSAVVTASLGLLIIWLSSLVH